MGPARRNKDKDTEGPQVNVKGKKLPMALLNMLMSTGDGRSLSSSPAGLNLGPVMLRKELVGARARACA